MTLYRVTPPSGLALPDVHQTKEQANDFFRVNYFNTDPDKGTVMTWYWLEVVRPFKFSDFIHDSVLTGPMKEAMAEKGIDDSALPTDLAIEFENAARSAVDWVAEQAGLDVPGYKVLESVRVDYPHL